MHGSSSPFSVTRNWTGLFFLFLFLTFAVVLTLVLRTPPRGRLDVGTPGDTHFIAGFSIPEVERDSTTTFRWSEPDARLMLHGANSGPFVLSLRLHNEHLSPTTDHRLALQRNGADVAAWEVAEGWRVYQVLLDAREVSQGLDATPLNLVSSTYRPGPGDSRELGVVLDWLELVPLSRDHLPLVGSAPQQQALLLTWGLVLLAGACWRVDRMLLPHVPRWTSVRIGALVVLLAGAVLLWAVRAPYTLAWAFPATPWMLGLATLALWGNPVIDAGRELAHAVNRRWHLAALTTLVLLAGMGSLIIAQVLFHRQHGIGVGIALAIAGGFLLCISSTGSVPGIGNDLRDEIPGDLLSNKRLALILLLGIFCVALGMRFYQITTLPYALWRDEARHGMIALHILEDPAYRPIYIAADRVNMPALGLYPFALALRIWGTHDWSMRPVTALMGALTVFPLYGLVRHLAGRRDLALLTVALLAVSSWHVTISRFSFPTIFDPFFGVLGLWLLLLGLDLRRGEATTQPDTRRSAWVRRLLLLLAGVCLGLAVQTYHTGRMVPVIAGALALLLLLAQPRRWRHLVSGMLIVGSGLAVTVAPLVIYAIRQPDAFNDRVSTVFLLGEAALKARAPLKALDTSIGQHLLMFNVQGDSNGRHHAPGRPMLDFVAGLGFLAGCAFLLRSWRDWRSLFLLAALGIALVPSALAVNGPHGMRSIGGTVFSAVIAALGWLTFGTMLWRAQAAPGAVTHWRRTGAVGGGVIFAAALALNAWMYFGYMPVQREVWGSSYPVHTQIGDYLRNLAEEQGEAALSTVYVPEALTRNAVFTYITDGLPVQSFTFTAESLEQEAQPGALFVLSGYTQEQDEQRLHQFLPDAVPVLHGPLFPGTDDPSFVVYQVPGAADTERRTEN